MTWNYFEPHFLYQEACDFSQNSWNEHRYFVYDLIRNIQPKVIVELGVEAGNSFFSMCQAVADSEHQTQKIVGIDSWIGDPLTGYYGEEVFQKFLLLKDNYYRGVPIEIHKNTFEKAAQFFGDNSIDLLHIDGYHAYHSVMRDFKCWIPKVKKDGIVLFHDVAVYDKQFGVHQLWEEVKQCYPTISFTHSYGLGVLLNVESPFASMFMNMQDIWRDYYQSAHQAALIREAIRNKRLAIANFANEIHRVSNEIESLEIEKQVFEASRQKLTETTISNLGTAKPQKLFEEVLTHRSSPLPKSYFSYELMRLSFFPDRAIPYENENPEPVVSIVIPVYNQIEYTLRCLKSLAYAPPQAPFEILVVDDGSTDSTAKILGQRTDIKYIYNTQNLGFVGSCNRGIKEARGKYIFLLNNDTIVLNKAIDAHLELLSADTSIGLSGSRLIFPDGRLQESGGIVWADGNACNYGKFDNALLHKYNFIREVDYCSGAAIMVPKAVLEKLGNLDERYAPAYYEDTDLAFAVRAAGYRVLYNPLSNIIHYEGGTAGVDTTKGVKAWQSKNKNVFVEKWGAQLNSLGLAGQKPLNQFANRYVKGRILVLDQNIPTPDQDSGSIDMFNLLKVLTRLKMGVTFVPCAHPNFSGKHTELLENMGVEVAYRPGFTTVESFLHERGSEFDIIIASRVTTAKTYLRQIKTMCPHAKVIFNTVDLHYIRMQREAAQQNDATLMQRAAELKKEELSAVAMADMTLVVSDTEKQILLQEVAGAVVRVIPLIRSIVPYKNNQFTRGNNSIAFIGGFEHTPNVDATRYFCNEIFPLLLNEAPDTVFHLVGSKMPDEIKRLAGSNIQVHGFLPNADELLEKCHLTVAPLRFGAGQKGKILHSLMLGIPCVTTPIGAEAMNLAHEEELLIADTPDQFAKSIVRLFRNEQLWQKLSKNGYNTVKRHYNIDSMAEKIEEIIRSLITI